MNVKRNKGFTLIELLVVIAIIGILSSVVLASLNTARDKGRDGAIKSSMQTVRVQAEIYYDDTAGGNQSYGTAGNSCAAAVFSEPTITAAISEIDGVDGGGANSVLCRNTAQAWAMAAPLNDPAAAGGHWCTDSTGVAIEIANAAALPNGDTTCN